MVIELPAAPMRSPRPRSCWEPPTAPVVLRAFAHESRWTLLALKAHADTLA